MADSQKVKFHTATLWRGAGQKKLPEALAFFLNFFCFFFCFKTKKEEATPAECKKRVGDSEEHRTTKSGDFVERRAYSSCIKQAETHSRGLYTETIA